MMSPGPCLAVLGATLLLAGCDERRPHVRGRSVQEWMAAVRDSGVSRADALSAIAQLASESPSAEPALEAALGAADPAARLMAVEGIGRAGGAAQLVALQRLELVVLRDPVDSLRARAAWALGRTTAGEPNAVASLTVALRDTSAVVRRAAAYALGAIGSPARASAGPLSGLRADPDSLVTRAGAEALARLRRMTP